MTHRRRMLQDFAGSQMRFDVAFASCDGHVCATVKNLDMMGWSSQSTHYCLLDGCFWRVFLDEGIYAQVPGNKTDVMLRCIERDFLCKPLERIYSQSIEELIFG